jgi:TRAP-type transport system periplasmic protein
MRLATTLNRLLPSVGAGHDAEARPPRQRGERLAPRLAPLRRAALRAHRRPPRRRGLPQRELGREIDLINGMQLGTVDMTITGESLQNWTPMAALLAIPYAYQSLEEMDEVAGGEIGDQIEAAIIENAQIRPIAYFARGPRNLTSNRPITEPDELNGLRLRVPNVPLFVDTWQALGAAADADGLLRGLHLAPERHHRRPGEPAGADPFGELQRGPEPREPHRARPLVDLPHPLGDHLGELSAEDQAAVMEAAAARAGIRARALHGRRGGAGRASPRGAA